MTFDAALKNFPLNKSARCRNQTGLPPWRAKKNNSFKNNILDYRPGTAEPKQKMKMFSELITYSKTRSFNHTLLAPLLIGIKVDVVVD
tara:strand:+ start:317 stop:580 length:264 start_codon:yes stop_codon:yes gene_type:complete